MSRKRNFHEEITIDCIFKELSSDFKSKYGDLKDALQKEPVYKRLKKMGENQFYKPISQPGNIEHKTTRLNFATISCLTSDLEDVIDEVIHKEIQGEYLQTLKNKVLEAALKLHSVKKNGFQESPENVKCVLVEKSDIKQEKDGEKVVLDKLINISQLFAENVNDIRKQVIEMPIEESKSNAAENPKNQVSEGEKISTTKVLTEKVSDIRKDVIEKPLEISESSAAKSPEKQKSQGKKLNNKNKVDEDDVGNISFESFSSVHTSELSSFDDELEFSSDDETGKRRGSMSWKEAEEKLADIKAKKLTESKGDQNQGKTVKHKDSSQSENLQTETASVSQKCLSRRARKPNSKYVSENVMSPLQKISIEKILASTPVSTAGNPRKRGRPRKHLT